jgi:GrpB-like predicted nucleotidyltransferase (UPF0157 family)
VVTTDADVSPVIERLASIDYDWVGDLGIAGREAFRLAVTTTLPAHHLYLVVENNRAHADHWLFRELLRADPDARALYAELKRENARLSRGDPERYTALKAAFVATMLRNARKQRGMQAVTYWIPPLDETDSTTCCPRA